MNNNQIDTYQTILAKSNKIEEQIYNGSSKEYRMVTGDRPTGDLHIGHYLGTLRNRVLLQNRGVETFVVIADYQVITDRTNIDNLKNNVFSLIADYLAAGIDPHKSVIYSHSAVSSLNQLLLPFMSLTSISSLQRNPTIKSEIEASQMDNINALMLTYPIHQAADILSLHGNVIPVGKDQLPHLQVAREIARKFNRIYCGDEVLFREPSPILSSAPMIYGIDGKKMSKSLNNSITLSMSENETALMFNRAATDNDRLITYDPVNRPNVANLLTIAAGFAGITPEEVASIIGNGGGKELKDYVTTTVNENLRNHRAHRKELLEDVDYLSNVLRDGNDKANIIANDTLVKVKQYMNMNY